MTVRIRLISLVVLALGTLVLANVEQAINDAMGKSTMLQHLVDAGRLSVVGAYYELVSGRVIFSAPVTAEQAASGTVKH